MGWLPAAAIGRGDIDFAADDWFYTCFLRRYIEINDAIHGTVVSDSQAVHTQLFGSGNELRYATHAVKQAIFGVDVKVGKLLRHQLDYSIWAKSPKRRVFHCQGSFGHHTIIINIPVYQRFCLNPISSFGAHNTV